MIKINVRNSDVFLVNPCYANLGIMKAACSVGLAFARNILQISKLILEVKQGNCRAVHIYQSAGFVSKEITSDGLIRMEIQFAT